MFQNIPDIQHILQIYLGSNILLHVSNLHFHPFRKTPYQALMSPIYQSPPSSLLHHLPHSLSCVPQQILPQSFPDFPLNHSRHLLPSNSVHAVLMYHLHLTKASLLPQKYLFVQSLLYQNFLLETLRMKSHLKSAHLLRCIEYLPHNLDSQNSGLSSLCQYSESTLLKYFLTYSSLLHASIFLLSFFPVLFYTQFEYLIF